MIYTELIQAITYQHILDFCAEGHRENIHLDYKKDIDRSLTKTIAAMANTWGGVIVIGVDEDDSKPKLPVIGIPFQEHIRERINNLILGNILPPVFPEIQVAQSPDQASALIVVRVAQSNLTPHAIRGNTQVYIRTDTSNEPEELATIDRIQWLVERRRQSENLKNSFFSRAQERFKRLCGRNGAELSLGNAILSASPLYPFEVLTNPKRLIEQLPSIVATGWQSRFPTLVHHASFEAMQGGTYGFLFNKESKYVCYEELNQFGFFYHQEDLVETRMEEEKPIHIAFLHTVLTQVDLFLESMARYYAGLHYWGSVELRIVLKEFQDVAFRDLPPRRGYIKIDQITKRPLEHILEFRKTLAHSELAEHRADVVAGLVLEIAWAVGFSHISEATIRALMEEAGRG